MKGMYYPKFQYIEKEDGEDIIFEFKSIVRHEIEGVWYETLVSQVYKGTGIDIDNHKIPTILSLNKRFIQEVFNIQHRSHYHKGLEMGHLQITEKERLDVADLFHSYRFQKYL